MTIKRIVGLVLIVLGVIVFMWGGLFWTDRDTVLDAGPVQITREDREGVSLPPILGAIAVVGGILLMALPDRRRV